MCCVGKRRRIVYIWFESCSYSCTCIYAYMCVIIKLHKNIYITQKRETSRKKKLDGKIIQLKLNYFLCYPQYFYAWNWIYICVCVCVYGLHNIKAAQAYTTYTSYEKDLPQIEDYLANICTICMPRQALSTEDQKKINRHLGCYVFQYIGISVYFTYLLYILSKWTCVFVCLSLALKK